MNRPFIVLGDKTTHGGVVISADLTSTIHGKAMARLGDLVACPKCKGVFAIRARTPGIAGYDGLNYARHMDLTDCGAYLLASQITSTGVDEQTPLSAASLNSTSIATPAASGICLACLRQAANLGSSVVIRE